MKKGQAVSLFIVVGVILLISFGVFLYLRTAVTRQSSDISTNFETQKVQLATQVQDCLRTQTKEAVDIYGITFVSLDSKITDYVNENLDECIPFEAFEKQGLKIEKEDAKVNTTITSKYLEVRVKYPITMSNKVSSAEIENFVYSMEVAKEKFLPNEKGVTTRDVVIELEDSGIKLEIPKGTLMLDMSNIEKGMKTEDIPRVDRIGVIIIGKNIIQNHFDTHISNKVYDLQPDDTWFYPAIKVSIIYNENMLPNGTNEDNLKIVYYEDKLYQWIELETIVDKNNNILTTHLNHFTSIGIQISEQASSYAIAGTEKGFCNNLYEDLMNNREACIKAIFTEDAFYNKKEVGLFFKKTGVFDFYIGMFPCTAIYFTTSELNLLSAVKQIMGGLSTMGMYNIYSYFHDRWKSLNHVADICKHGGHPIDLRIGFGDDVDKYKNGEITVAMQGCIDYLKGKKERDGVMYELAKNVKDTCEQTLEQYEYKQLVKCPGKDYLCRSAGEKYEEDSGCEIFRTEEQIEGECGAIVSPEEELDENRKNIDEFVAEEVSQEATEDVVEEELEYLDNNRCNELAEWCNSNLDIDKDTGVVTELWEGEDAQCPPLDEEGNEVPLPEGVSCYGEKCTEYDLLYETEQCYQFSTTDPSTQICPEGTQLRPYHCPGDSSVRCCVRDEVINFYSGAGTTTIISIDSEAALREEIAAVLADSANLETWGCEDLESLKTYVSRINSIYASIYYTSKLEGSTELSGKLIEANNQLIACIGEEAAEEVIEEAKEGAEEEVVEETEDKDSSGSYCCLYTLSGTVSKFGCPNTDGKSTSCPDVTGVTYHSIVNRACEEIEDVVVLEDKDCS